jgi:hypothetical protein
MCIVQAVKSRRLAVQWASCVVRMLETRDVHIILVGETTRKAAENEIGQY